jgi:hypothetical protein
MRWLSSCSRHKKQAVENEPVKTTVLSFPRCPDAPSCGYVARVAALVRRK